MKDKYEMIEKLNNDFNVVVYKGFDKTKNQYVRINENKKYYLSNETIKIIKNFPNSNNINKILEIIETKNYFYIIEELCNYTLEDLIKKEEILSMNKIQEIFLQINNVFKIFLEKGIILKQILPERILLNDCSSSNKCIIKISLTILINFDNMIGEEHNHQLSLTQSPELLKRDNVTNKCDIWSLGIILYLLCFKEYPYKGKTEYELYKEITSNKKLKEPNDEDLKDLLNKMLKINFTQRISWNDYFNHPFFKKNFSEDNNLLYDNSILNKMSFQINKLYEDNLNFEIYKLGYETKIKQYEEKIKKIEEENKNDKNKIKQYEEKIKKIEEENKNDKNKIKQYEEKIKKFEEENKNDKKKIKLLEEKIEEGKEKIDEIKKESKKDKEKINQIEKQYNEINKNFINITKNYQNLKRRYEGK